MKMEEMQEQRNIFYESVFRYKYEDSGQSMSALNTFADCIVTKKQEGFVPVILKVWQRDKRDSVFCHDCFVFKEGKVV